MSAVLAPARPRHWSLALAAALLLHGGLAVVFHEMIDGGTRAAGIGGVAVGLPPAGAAPGAAAEVTAPEAEEVPAAEATEVVPAEAVPPPVPEAAPLPQVEAAAPPPAAEPLYAPTPPVEPAPVEVETVEATPVEVETVEAKPAMAVPEPPRAKPQPPREETPVEASPVPAEAAEPTPAPAQVAAKTGPRNEGASAGEDVAGNAGKAGAANAKASGATEGHSGGGAPGAFVDYKAQLYAWLVKHKEYPRRARLRRQEGTARLYFAMDRNGRVLEYRIVASSGYKLLDEEVVAMIERASPLPPPPESLGGERLDYIVPVEFFQH
ncbi:MAG TPA: energy transducer TonB [Kiloniellaceae bacterium]|nr:energy transducer TonB [Kiloniellaceae bacterium]